MDPQKQNNISTLPTLSQLKLENLFNVYNDGQNYYYNLLGTVNIPQDLDTSTYIPYTVYTDNMPWTLISYKVYNTIDLWWLICSTNNIQNPLQFPKAGTVLKILSPDYVSAIIQQITTSQ
jgi:hypothetical protein